MGVHTATVSIVIDELVQTPYTFAVQGIWGASQYQIITGTAGNGHGSVNLNPPGGTYTEGTVVTVNATADTGSHFVKWSGSCTDTKDCLLTLHDNKIVIATFAQLPNGLAVGLIRNTPDPIQSGDTITWEVVLTNTGEITLTVETISATHTSRVQTNDVAHEDRAEVKCATPFALGIGDVERCTLLDQITEAAGSHVDFQVSVTCKSVGINLPVSASVISQIDVVSPSEDQIYLPLLSK